MQEALNRNSLNETGIYIKRVIKYTVCFELIGAICLAFVFIPQFGILKGIYYSLFHAISAFCNAGFDILGNNSMVPYVGNVWINLVICGLIIAGGLGFVVWIDLRLSLIHYREHFKYFKMKKVFRIFIFTYKDCIDFYICFNFWRNDRYFHIRISKSANIKIFTIFTKDTRKFFSISNT